MKKWIVLLGLSCLLSACANYQTQVSSQGRNVYKIVSNSSRQGDAIRGARNESRNFCEQQDKVAAVLNYNTNFYGKYDQQTYRALNIHSSSVAPIFDASTKMKRTNHDFVTTMRFRCVRHHP